jgi:hypothetical protein
MSCRDSGFRRAYREFVEQVGAAIFAQPKGERAQIYDRHERLVATLAGVATAFLFA